MSRFPNRYAWSRALIPLVVLSLAPGCAQRSARVGDGRLEAAIVHYRSEQFAQGRRGSAGSTRRRASIDARAAVGPPSAQDGGHSPRYARFAQDGGRNPRYAGSTFQTTSLSTEFADLMRTSTADARDEPPSNGFNLRQDEDASGDTYWKDNLLDQAGSELKDFATRGFWQGFKTAFWDVDNAIILGSTFATSVALRESRVDRAVRRRVRGHRQLGDFDEPIQLLGNPGTHFAAAGLLWLGSDWAKDKRKHELSRTLTEALAVTGITTAALKVSTNTHSPDGEGLAWPSGHASSSFTVAAVLNEYYGPWVGVPSLALAGLVGYQRIDSRAHDFSDVVFGAMLGYVVGTSIARDEKARLPELFGMTVLPFNDPETGASGLSLMKSW